MTLRRLLCLLCLAACSVALVGCGGDTLALDPVARAADNTASSYSARFTFAADVRAAEGKMSLSGNGLFDGRAKRGWMNMTMKVPPQLQASVGANPSMELIFDAADGLVMYIRSSMFPGLDATKWVKFDVEKLADKAGVDLDALMNTNQADPSQVLGMLKASSRTRVGGVETVRGVRTTKYSLQIDLQKLGEGLGDSYKQALEMTGLKTIPAQAWIDAKDRVRRIKMTMSMRNGYGMTITEDLFDFGVRADIYPPADADVVDLSALLGG